MIIDIPYGKEYQHLEVRKKNLRAVLTPHTEENAGRDEEAIVRHALENPIDSLRLADLAQDKKNILVITSDHTRPVPSRVTMPLLLEEIRRKNPDGRVTILIATGMHRQTTQAELQAKFGDEIVRREHIAVHDANGQAAFFGILPSGGELWLNHLVLQADLVVAEGFIEPHFFAGFSGGRKSILPGIASRKTVLYNHNAQFLQSPYARQGVLENNPIHKDMVFAAQQAKLQFILNVVLDGEKRVLAAFAGDTSEAHEAGCAYCGQRATVQAVVSDIAVASNGGYPLDQNVYQSVKGMTAAEACVRPGGVVIMCAALGDGHGGQAFYEWFSKRENAREVMCDILSVPPADTAMDQWEAQILARVMLKAACIFVTGAENRSLIESMHMLWAENVSDALQMAYDMVGDDASVTVIPDGVGVIVR